MAHRTRGFTIIETVLVLAVTGLVLSVVLVGIGSSLRAERYRDAVNQTLDFFQGQYNLSSNIYNDRSSTDTCTISGINPDSGGQGRGTSGCLILGRILRSTDGQNISIKQVIARIDPTSITDEAKKTNVQVLRDSALTDGGISSSYQIAWNATLLNPASHNPSAFTMMVVQSPVSGMISTFVDATSGTPTIASLLTTAQPVPGTVFCIDPSGIMNIGTQPTGIVIDANAANTSGVRQAATGSC